MTDLLNVYLKASIEIICFKGGFYLSSLFGIENRSTIDIDAAIRKAKFTEDNLLK